MVQLQLLSSTKGNSGQRFFPYTGYLGLTPIRVEGVVRTKLDADLKPLQAKAITISVRCYETRTGRVNVLQSKILVDYTHTLWSKPDNQDYENIGNMDFPFRMSVPANVSGYSTATFVDYRCVWRVEAVLHHNYIHGVGARLIRHFDLPLIRYDVPYYPTLPSSSSSSSSLDQVTTKLRAPRIKYSLNSPKTPIGPLDLVSVPIHLLPVDPAVSIRSASMVVERRIQLHDIQPLSPPSSSSPPHLKKTISSSSLSSPNSTLEPSPSSSNYPSSLSSYDTFNSDSPDPSLLAVNLYPHPSLPPHSKSPEYNFDPLASTSSLASSIPTITPGTVYPSSCAVSVISESTPLIPHSQDSSTSSSQSQTRFLSHSNSHSRSISHTFSPNSPPSGHYESIPTTPQTDTPSTPSSPPPSSPLSPPKTIVNSIADVSSSGNFTRDGNGVFSKTLTLQWPAAKSQSRWAVGETIKGSDLVSVRFFLRTKITVSSPSGTETIDLADQELLVVSTNEAERQLALVKWNEMMEASGQSASEGNANRSKSKSPRRAGRDRERDEARQGRSTGSVNEPEKDKEKSHRAKSSTRRPHTSAGPRDRFTNFAGGAFGVPVPVPDLDPRFQQNNIPPSSFKSASVAIDNVASPKRRSDGASMAKSGGPSGLNLGTFLSSPNDSQSAGSKGKVSRPGSSSGRSKNTASNSTLESGSSTAHPLLCSAPGGNGKISSSSFWSTTHSNPKISSSSSKNSKSKGKGVNSQTSSSESSRFSDGSRGTNKMTNSAPGRVANSTSTSTSGSTTSASTSLSRSTSTSRSTADEEDFDHCDEFAGKALRKSRMDSISNTQRPSTASSAQQPQPQRESTDRNMREWEEELARIEMRSRKSSDLLGFAGKRSVRKAVGAVMKAFGGDSERH